MTLESQRCENNSILDHSILDGSVHIKYTTFQAIGIQKVIRYACYNNCDIFANEKCNNNRDNQEFPDKGDKT